MLLVAYCSYFHKFCLSRVDFPADWNRLERLLFVAGVGFLKARAGVLERTAGRCSRCRRPTRGGITRV